MRGQKTRQWKVRRKGKGRSEEKREGKWERRGMEVRRERGQEEGEKGVECQERKGRDVKKNEERLREKGKRGQKRKGGKLGEKGKGG